MRPNKLPPAHAAPFELVSEFTPRGDQPAAIQKLNENIGRGAKFQTVLGVTGSGKTYTVANLVAKHSRPVLVMAPNKTLAAQLYCEFRDFFPKNRVHYFVSYYDYYQPEAYVPSTDTFIEKDAAINEEIDKMRHAATKALIERRDTLIVASVSCIYGLGAPEDYLEMMLFMQQGQAMAREDMLAKLVTMQYRRAQIDFRRGTFRVQGETVDIFPSDQDESAVRIVFFGEEIEEIRAIDALSGRTTGKLECCTIYPVSHFVTSRARIDAAIKSIGAELQERLKEFRAQGKLLESQRLEQRTLYDLELMDELGFCPGIENYSRHLAGRNPGEPPTTLLDYFPQDFLLVIDESHVTVPQISGMCRGDQARKRNLVEYGFRLPSALDNRPLNFEEFWQRAGQTIFVSATPAEFELEKSAGLVVQMVNRPTGIADPAVDVRPALNQVDDLLAEIRETIIRGDKVLVTTLTKRMAENLADYLREVRIKCRYMHSDIDALERVEIIRGLKRGDFDVLIGINLLREGLDISEVSLVAILDADKEGFLRSARSLIQTMGRAARNVNGKVILYADRMTDSMRDAIAETTRRREIQLAFNKQHGIVPVTTASRGLLSLVPEAEDAPLHVEKGGLSIDIPKDDKAQKQLLDDLRKQMFDAAARREFEHAAKLRDTIKEIQTRLIDLK